MERRLISVKSHSIAGRVGKEREVALSLSLNLRLGQYDLPSLLNHSLQRGIEVVTTEVNQYAMFRWTEIGSIRDGTHGLALLNETGHLFIATLSHQELNTHYCLIKVDRPAKVGRGDFKECN